MSYKRDIYPYTYVRCICEIMTKDAKYNAVCHWIVNCYLSTKEGLKVFYVNISHHVPHVCWHLTGPSIMASSAFILICPSKQLVMMVWQFTQQWLYYMCHNHVNHRRKTTASLFVLFHAQTLSVCHVRRVGDKLHERQEPRNGAVLA